MKIRQEKGITLVALIITIIVLLILAMVSISLVMNGGIIDKSKAAIDKYSEEEIGEQLKLAYSEYQMSQYTGTPIDIQAKLREIYGNDITATLANGKLKATINGKVYQYDVNSGKSGEYVDPINYGTKTKETIVPGDDITLGTEKFKVFSVSNSEIKAMPYYNLVSLNGEVKQGTDESIEIYSRFSTTNYWTQGEDAIEMSNSNNIIQQYINDYKTTLDNIGGEELKVRAAKYSELTTEGVTSIMRNPGQTGGVFWIGSSNSEDDCYVWAVEDEGTFNYFHMYSNMGVRPIIIIQK